MYVDALRQVKAWLSHATYGVNALLASVPKDGGDAALPTVTIYEASTTAWVARGRIDRGQVGSGALLLVQPADEDMAELQAEGSEVPAMDAHVTIAIRYATRKTDTSVGQAQAWQTLRAVARSIHAQAARTSVTRNSSTLGPVVGTRYVRMLDEEGDDWIVDALLVTLRVVDPWAVAAT